MITLDQAKILRKAAIYEHLDEIDRRIKNLIPKGCEYIIYREVLESLGELIINELEHNGFTCDIEENREGFSIKISGWAK